MSSLKSLLTNIVKEKSISNSIINYKNEMELINDKRLYKEWVEEEKFLSKELNQAKDNVPILKHRIKDKCLHADVTEELSPGWERSQHSYRCNICKFYVRIHEEFDYRNITKTIE